MIAKLIKFIRKNYIQIIIAIIIIAIIDRILMRTETYQQLAGCIPYTMLGKDVPYMECKRYGYVVPTLNPKLKQIMVYKCKTGLPANTMRYKIIIDEIERYSEVLKYQPMGHVVGASLRFDNNKDYQFVSTDPNTVL